MITENISINDYDLKIVAVNDLEIELNEVIFKLDVNSDLYEFLSYKENKEQFIEEFEQLDDCYNQTEIEQVMDNFYFNCYINLARLNDTEREQEFVYMHYNLIERIYQTLDIIQVNEE